MQPLHQHVPLPGRATGMKKPAVATGARAGMQAETGSDQDGRKSIG